MPITNERFREEYEGTDGPAVVLATFVRDTTIPTHRIELGGFIQISENGVQNSDLLAAKNALEEILLVIRDKYPYTAP